jgi:hypothetical protein
MHGTGGRSWKRRIVLVESTIHPPVPAGSAVSFDSLSALDPQSIWLVRDGD